MHKEQSCGRVVFGRHVFRGWLGSFRGKIWWKGEVRKKNPCKTCKRLTPPFGRYEQADRGQIVNTDWQTSLFGVPVSALSC